MPQEIKIHCLFDEMVKPSKLKKHPKNRNKHPKEQIERLAKILSYQGFRYPIKVSKLSGFITSGHGRAEAAKLLKLTEIPVVYQDYESDEQEYADVQSDNAIASWSELDLSDINTDIQDLGPDFDIDLLGIKNFTIDVAEKVNKGDENSEWVEMPDFDKADAQFKITIVFNTELEREMWVKERKILVDRKMNNQWVSYK